LENNMKTKKQFGGTYKAEYTVVAAAVLTAAISAASTFETNLTSSNTTATGNFATELGSLDSGVTTTSGGETGGATGSETGGETGGATGGETGGTFCHAEVSTSGGFVGLASGNCSVADMETLYFDFSQINFENSSVTTSTPAASSAQCDTSKNFIYYGTFEGAMGVYFYADGTDTSTTLRVDWINPSVIIHHHYTEGNYSSTTIFGVANPNTCVYYAKP